MVLSEIIKSKDKLYAALHKLKDTSHVNISAVPQAVGVSIGQSSGQVSHELIVSKPETSQAVNLPIEFVPAVLPEPSDVGTSSLKRRRKNKKKPNKKLRSDAPYVLVSLFMFGMILVLFAVGFIWLEILLFWLLLSCGILYHEFLLNHLCLFNPFIGLNVLL